MNSDRVFQISFLVSVLAHGIILCANPNFSFFSKKAETKAVEITYVKNNQIKTLQKTLSPIRRESLLKITDRIALNNKTAPPYINKREQFVSLDSSLTKPVFIKPEIVANKKRISLPPIDLEKNNNPSYISYYQIIREKIKRAAYQNYSGDQVGQVYISFIISNDGALKESRLVENKSTLQTYLKEIALESVRDASPFPNFPKELDYPSLSFNVIISFGIE